jgi:exportin-1
MAAGGCTMDRILSDPLDISLLDAVVQTFYTSAGPEQKRAADLLAQFQAQPDSWKKVDAILLQSNYMHTKVSCIVSL